MTDSPIKENTRNTDSPGALPGLAALLFILLLTGLVLTGLPFLTHRDKRGKQQGGEAIIITEPRVAEVAEDSALVTWKTSVPADSQVIWTEHTAKATAMLHYATPRQSELVLDHKVRIKPLRPGTDYSVTVVSATKEGLICSAEGPRFRTLGFSHMPDLAGTERGRIFANLPPMGTGLSWVDFDSDGRFDVFIASDSLAGSRLLKNTPQGFVDVTSLSANAFGGRGRQSAWADYNADGHPDLLVTSGRGMMLFTNDGPPNFTFRDSSSLLPQQRFYDTEGAGWLDYNNDGKPDILVTNGKYGILLFENTGDSFRDVSTQAGLGESGFGAGMGDYITLGDYDGDGRTDFLYNLYTGILGRNVGGRFEKADNAGINYLCTSTRKLGTAFGDYDNDGYMDIFVPQRDASKLYRNKCNGQFEEVAKQAGLLTAPPMDAVSAAWGDVNNDGFLDLFVGCEGTQNRLFLNNGNGTFRDVTDTFGLAGTGGRARGITFVDYDNDGDLDIYVHNYQPPDYFYENPLITADNHNYVQVRFSPRRCAIGGEVRLLSAEGILHGMRQIFGAQGYGSQEPPMAHFGAAPGRYKVTVRYTNGHIAEKQVTVDSRGNNQVTFE